MRHTPEHARRSPLPVAAALVLVAMAFVAAAVGAPGPASAQTADTSATPTIVVLVVDGLLPDEIGPTTPTLQALKADGTWYEESRSVMIAETIPNHVAMMTGVYPERSNIPANSFWDRDETAPEGRDLSDPSELTADTLFTTIDRACPSLRTASILSKTYLFEIFQAGGQNVAADFHWEPGPIIPESGHTPDVNTMSQVLPALETDDLVFVNLGDVDRSGHVDITGGFFDVPDDLGIPDLVPTPNNALARQAVLRDTDTLIGQAVRQLQDGGRWENTVLFVVSDHGMDWSDPLGFTDVQSVLDDLEADRFLAVINGAAQTVYLRNPGQPDDDADLAAARAAVLDAYPDAVAQAWYRRPNLADPGADRVVPERYHLDSANVGDLVLLAADGWRFAGSSPSSNPIPGNHGHLVTRHNTFLITGGHPGLVGAASIAAPAPDPDNAQNFDNQSENVDIAPTVAWLLGLPTDDYQGRVLREAFSPGFTPTSCVESTGAGAGASPATTPTTAVPVGGGTLAATGSDAGPWPFVLLALAVGVYGVIRSPLGRRVRRT